MRLQYRDFLNKIENNLSDDAEDTKLKSMDILKMFLSPELKLYENVETIVHILCTAATTMSVESVLRAGFLFMRIIAINIGLSQMREQNERWLLL